MTIATFSILVLYFFSQTIGLAAAFVGWWPGQKSMGWRIVFSTGYWIFIAAIFNYFFQTMGSHLRVPLVGDPRVVTLATVFCLMGIALIHAIVREFREE